MAIKEQENDNKNNVVSPLANDPTYGEKVYNLFFNVGINFLVNLVASAGFSYWVNHSTKGVKVPWKSEPARPGQIQADLEQGIAKHVLRVADGVDAPFRRKAAQSMAGVATLTAAGHFIMIPSVWLGAKIKAPMVKWLNARHYGRDAMDDPSLKARHDALEIEERPTLFGAIVGRLGTIVATQTTAWAVGHDLNLVKKAGQIGKFQWSEKFNGLDAVTESIGDGIGGGIAQKFEEHNAALNGRMIKREYGWSLTQEKKYPELKTLAYGKRIKAKDGTPMGGGFYEHFGRNVAADILYTAVTSVTIGPAIRFLKQYIPGMTYTPKAALKLPEEARRTADALRVKPHPIRDAQEVSKPYANVSDITHLDRVTETPQREVAGV